MEWWDSELELLLGLGGDHLRDGERARGAGGRSVADVEESAKRQYTIPHPHRAFPGCSP